MLDQAIDAVDEYTAKNLGKYGAGVFVGLTFWASDKVGVTNFQEYESFKRDTAYSGALGLFGNDVVQVFGGDGILGAASDDPMILAGLTTVTGGRAALHRHRQNGDAAARDYRQAVKDWKAKYSRADGAHIAETSEEDPCHQTSIMSVDEDRFRDLYDVVTAEHTAEVQYRGSHRGDCVERDAYQDVLDDALADNEVATDQFFIEWEPVEDGTRYRAFAVGREGPIGEKIRRDEPLLEANTVIPDRRIDDPVSAYLGTYGPSGGQSTERLEPSGDVGIEQDF